MQIKKYQNTPGPISRATDEYYNGTGWHFVPGTQLKQSDPNYSVAQRKGLNTNYLVDENGTLVPERVRSAYEQNKQYQAQLPYQEQNDINDARQMQIRQGDRDVRNRSMTQMNKTEMNNLLNLGLTIGGTAAAVPAAWMAPIATAGAFAGGIAGNYLGDKVTKYFSNGKYNTWGDAVQDWTNDYIRADNGQITNPGALLGGTIGSATAKPIFNFGRNVFNGARNYFGNRFVLANANQAAAPTTVSGLSLDTDLGEIMGRMRLGLKNTREYYNGEGFAQRMRNAGFTDDEIGQARMEIDDLLSNNSTEILPTLEKKLQGRAARSFSVGSDFMPKVKMITQYFPEQNENLENFTNTIYHELTGHTSTANIDGNQLANPASVIQEIAARSDYPILSRMTDYNEGLLLKPNPKVVGKLPHGKSDFDYLVKPTEVRARAIEETMTGKPNINHKKGFQIFDEGDWNAYLQQFLKKGGKYFSRSKKFN